MGSVVGQPLPLTTEMVRIRPTRRWSDLGLAELWRHRELIYFMAWRDLRVRYKQTALGVFWAVLSPILNTVLFSLIFGVLADLPSEGVPYLVFTFCAMVPWQLFLRGLNNASSSIVANQSLVTKVYFPRMVIPVSAILSGSLDFLISLGLLVVLMLAFGVTPTWAAVWLPVYTLLTLLAALTAGLWMSALNVRYRDAQQLLPFLNQIWFYATPIAYSMAIVPPRLWPFYSLNPMVGIVNGFRWALLGTAQAPDVWMWISTAILLVLLVLGILYFRRVEDTFADHV